ncbi:MAG: hypothetical protein IKM51_03360 [Oscillospiraceae bacterium]|nr:hypothetical protein [Oscillospiraceae bacterium]
MKYIFAAALGRASKYGKNAAHIGYELDSEGRLVQRGIPDELKGGIMVLTLRNGKIHSIAGAAADIALECAKREYSGLIADIECSYDKGIETLLKQLDNAGVSPLYIPQEYSNALPSARVMISSALKSGSFDAALTDAGRAFGSKAVLQLDRLCEDSPLPCRSCDSKKLKPRDRSALQQRSGAQGFFSPKLMTNYFTYYDNEKTAHFVLYDTSSSIKRKLELAAQRGYEEVIIAPEQFEDIWSDIW